MKDIEQQKGSARRDPTIMRGRLYRMTIYILIVLALAILVWKMVSDGMMESRHAEELKNERETASIQLAERTENLATVAGVAAGLAFRDALMADDVDRMREYADQLVQGGPVDVVMVTGADGVIRASSDRNREGTGLDATLRSLLGTLDHVLVDEVGQNRVRAVVPLTGFNERIGAVVILFRFTSSLPSAGE
ncbi:MAG: hypothetical protein JXA28_09105 [Bacteroidetes bacterium]|nr:hypothetical protein [Bacteroidota bacterium]